ncbi:MAG TPA: GrpB family protein [Blastocatellia bacterium]|nr:GrpB family protein [Blastocatellia bacterium]
MGLQIQKYELRQPIFCPADPEAASVAQRLAEAIVSRDGRLAVEHIGSTAVPGCGGKGYIDLLVLYPEGLLDAAKAALDALGYQRQPGREPFPEERPMRVGCVESSGRRYPVHAHVVAANDPEAERLLAFRDWLRRDAAEVRAYEAEKLRILAAGVLDGVDYAERKTRFIEAALAAGEGADPQRVN